MTVSVTLQFSDIAAAVQALSRLSSDNAAAAAPTVIAHADRPDVGAPTAPLPTLTMPPLPTPAALDPAAVFGGAVAHAPLAAPAAPTLPAAPSAPSAATVPTVAPVGAEVDSTGLVWDSRIHASTKTKVASGAWTAKRNVDPAFKEQVEATLRAVPTVPVAPAAATPTLPVAPAAATPTLPVAPAAAAPTAETFGAYMARIGGAFSARPVDAHNAMVAALAPYGLTGVGQLAAHGELIPAVDAAFQAALSTPLPA